MPESGQTVPVGTPTAKEIAGINCVQMNNGAHFGFIQTVCERIEKETIYFFCSSRFVERARESPTVSKPPSRKKTPGWPSPARAT